MAACKFVVGVIAVFCFSLYGVDGQDNFSEFSHTCAVSCSDKISCWGDNRYGQLGSNNTNLTENQIEMRDVKQISTGLAHTCALKNDGSVSCWGLNGFGQLGNSFNSGTGTANPNPFDVDVLNVKQIILRFKGLDFCPLIVKIFEGYRPSFAANSINEVSSLKGITTLKCPVGDSNWETDFRSSLKGMASSKRA